MWEHIPNYQRLEFLGDSLLDQAFIMHLVRQGTSNARLVNLVNFTVVLQLSWKRSSMDDGAQDADGFESIPRSGMRKARLSQAHSAEQRGKSKVLSYQLTQTLTCRSRNSLARSATMLL